MYEAKIVLDSIGPTGARLTTFALTYPRFVHAELLTHRMFSRNSASSRAIPTAKLLRQIEVDPVLPVHWGANQSGMQAAGELTDLPRAIAEATWLHARNDALRHCKALLDHGLHKQLANRPLEAWMWITVIVTATELDNAWALRIDPMAQPEFCHIMAMAKAAFDASVPHPVAHGEWHLPYVTGYDEGEIRAAGFDEIDRCRISCARVARVSYLTHEGKRDPEHDLALAAKLRIPGHMSPFEHAAKALDATAWAAYAVDMGQRWAHDRVPVGNFWGWAQFRKELAHEHDFSKIKAARQ
jgi:thymidylate synthase ThyX